MHPPPPPPPPLPFAAEEFPHLVALSNNKQRDALFHQQQLKHVFSSIQALRTSHELQTCLTDETMTAIETHLHGLDTFLSNILTASTYNQVRAADSTAAARVFQVPELVEFILSELSLPDLLTMHSVSSTFKAAIDSSPKLQIKLFARPAPPASPCTFPCAWEMNRIAPGFFCTPRSPSPFASATDGMPDSYLAVKASFHLRERQTLSIYPARTQYVHLPTAYRGVGSPSYLLPQAWPVEGPGDPRPHHATDLASSLFSTTLNQAAIPSYLRAPIVAACILHNPAGLTIGELHDCAKMVIELHRHCPHANHRQLDDFGFVDAGLYFSGRVAVSKTDPVLCEMATQHEARTRSRTDNKVSLRRRKRHYAMAKVSAMNEGRPIPTLQEFLQARAQETATSAVQGEVEDDDWAGFEFVGATTFSGMSTLPHD